MTTINVTKISDEKFTVTFPYDPYLVRRIKQLEGASWDAESKMWTVDCKGGYILVDGVMKPVNQVAMVRGGYLTPHVNTTVINFTNLTKK